MTETVVKIYDTTLRDGLRNSGAILSLEQKVQVARQLEVLRVDAIEVGYGGPSQVEPMQAIAQAVSEPVVFGLSRVNLKDVRRVLQGVKPARKPGINVFIPTSDIFLDKMALSRQQALDAIGKAVEYARQYLDCIVVSAQDAARSDPDYLVEVCQAVVAAGAATLSLADTTGQAVPHQFGLFCSTIRKRVAGGDAVTWSVHCHNDLGLGLANSLAAVGHGVRQVECTLNGIGERAGNTPLEEVVTALTARADAFSGLSTNVVTEQLAPSSRLLAQLTGLPVSVNKPVVGANVIG